MCYSTKVLATAFVAILLNAAGGSDFASAAVNFKQNRNPAFTDGGVTLTAKGALVGLGEGGVTITLTAEADADSTCTNKGGGEAPGQNPAPTTVADSEAFPAGVIKNGTLSFTIVTEKPVSPIPGAPGCPSPQWSETIDDLLFTSAILTVVQQGVVVLRATCTFSPPITGTVDGPVPALSVKC